MGLEDVEAPPVRGRLWVAPFFAEVPRFKYLVGPKDIRGPSENESA
jgi:hypothetical protein